MSVLSPSSLACSTVQILTSGQPHFPAHSPACDGRVVQVDGVGKIGQGTDRCFFKIPTRRQVLLDWLFDGDTDIKLVQALRSATAMLGDEYRSMIRVEDSSLLGHRPPLDANRVPRSRTVAVLPEACLSTAERASGVMTCYPGDVLRLRMALQNCFRQPIPNPSGRVSWVATLTPLNLSIKAALGGSRAATGEPIAVEVLGASADPQEPDQSILFVAIPQKNKLPFRDYRIDIRDLK